MQLSITEICCDKVRYMQLLLIGDESELMVRRYLDRGTLYVAEADGRPVAVCVTTVEAENTVEVKNLAVSESYRRKGLGRRMLEHIEGINRGKTITLGTGETPSTLRFYESCGYKYSHRIRNFFTENYDHPIVEEGVLLCDMVYLKKELNRL